MFLNTASPRRSFNIPININLQGARRRQTRELFHTAQEQDGKGADGRGGQRVRSQVPVSSVGEDRTILLGFTMMAFSVLMFFVVGISIVKPFVNSKWKEEASCVLVQANTLDEWVDCRGVSTVPCLQVTVNLTTSDRLHHNVTLRYDEESVLLAHECFYIPKCQMDKKTLQDEVKNVTHTLNAELNRSRTCFTDGTSDPKDVILQRKYTLEKSLLALLWPCLMLGGGALLVALVKLTQCLAHLAAEMCGDRTASRTTLRYTQGKLYRLLRRSSMQSAS